MTTEEYNHSVELFSDGVYRFILKSLRDEEKAKDIVQESYEKLWKYHADVDYPRVKSYLFSTAYHTMIDQIRREKRKVDFEQVDTRNYSFEHANHDLQEIINEGLKRLPAIQKDVLLLRDYEGYSYKEIGEIVGLGEAQVKVYIYRARVGIKNYVGKLENVI